MFKGRGRTCTSLLAMDSSWVGMTSERERLNWWILTSLCPLSKCHRSLSAEKNLGWQKSSLLVLCYFHQQTQPLSIFCKDFFLIQLLSDSERLAAGTSYSSKELWLLLLEWRVWYNRTGSAGFSSPPHAVWSSPGLKAWMSLSCICVEADQREALPQTFASFLMNPFMKHHTILLPFRQMMVIY